MKVVKLNQVKKGEYLIRGKGIDLVIEGTRTSGIVSSSMGRGNEPVIKESMVWVKGDYIRETRKYSVTKFSDMNRENCLPGSALVWVGFTF